MTLKYSSIMYQNQNCSLSKLSKNELYPSGLRPVQASARDITSTKYAYYYYNQNDIAGVAYEE